ncbi:MAG TPA: hypothetical protein ENI98_05030 [Gammaproteobacteria bacterium]|nr:hypothetical protein [Gammaproteobacteria bacterium]
MVITDKFIFLHLHKSGGTFVNDFIGKFFPSAQKVGYHLPGSCIPEPYRHLPVLGIVRSPWSYYVSWYTFQAGMASPNIIFRAVSDNGMLGFNETIRNLLELSNDRERLQRIVAHLPDSFTNAGINLTKQCMVEFEGSGTGFYSFLYNRMFSGVTDMHIGKTESIRPDLLAFLREAGVELTPDMVNHINASPRLNATRHKSSAEMYERETADLVADRDRTLIAKHDYSFQVSKPLV